MMNWEKQYLERYKEPEANTFAALSNKLTEKIMRFLLFRHLRVLSLSTRKLSILVKVKRPNPTITLNPKPSTDRRQIVPRLGVLAINC